MSGFSSTLASVFGLWARLVVTPVPAIQPQFMGVEPMPLPGDACHMVAVIGFPGTGEFTFNDISGLSELRGALWNTPAPYELKVDGMRFLDFVDEQLEEASRDFKAQGCMPSIPS